jgi:mannose-6-phosphate isomerase
VHPDDELAAERHQSCGKTEMWYIMDAEPDALLYIGFKNPNITREEYIDAVAKGTVAEIIEPVKVKAGDAFLIPSGTVHSISGGVSLVEIQQPVDLTYRIFDWNRVDSDGNSRELHTAYAVDAIDFSSNVNVCRREYKAVLNSEVEIARSDYFTCNILKVEGATERNLGSLDSFVLYYCTEGSVEIVTDDGSETLRKGEVVLIPAEANEITINGSATLLEYYVD